MNLKFNVQGKTNNEKVMEALRNVLFKSMLKLHALSKQRAPVDTGRLRNSISLSPMSPGYDRYTLVVAVHYGIHLEFGTYKMEAQPYIRPSLSEVKNKWVKEYSQKEFKK